MSWRGVLAYCTWPFVMMASVGAAVWGIEAGYDPGTWAFAVSVANFNLVVLKVLNIGKQFQILEL